jgi:D-erythronate 2-dehydrogenase
MKTVIVGAGGFVGQRLAEILLAEVAGLDELVLVDQAPIASFNDSRACVMAGDFSDAQLMERATDGATSVIVLAAILGGAAEANYGLARRVNVDATLTLFEMLRDRNPATRVVFASTIAVFSKPMPAEVTDATPTGPSMIYGAQKLMMEVALSNFAARGWLDGLSLRPSGVMARDGADARQKSAFMNRLFYAVKRQEDMVLPVHPHSHTWLTSVDAVARNFAHGALLPADRLGKNRALTLPALCLSFEEVVAALFRRFPDSRSNITYAADEDVVALFGSYPPLKTKAADALGFIRDADADDLVARSMP